MQVLADQPDDELVVVGVEPVAGEADVVCQSGFAVGSADDRVLAQDAALLAGLELLEGSAPAQRIPHRPAALLVESSRAWTLQQPVFEIRLEAAAVAAPEHGHRGPELQSLQALLVEDGPDVVDEVRRVLAPGQERDAARVVHVPVHDRGHAASLERAHECALRLGGPELAGAVEDQELHEQPAVHHLRLAVALGASFLDVHVGWFVLSGRHTVPDIAQVRPAPRAISTDPGRCVLELRMDSRLISSAGLSTHRTSDRTPPAPAAPSAGGQALKHPLPGGMRDLLPGEAERQSRLARRLMQSFELFGYQRVSVPAFEYAEVLEKGLGSLDPGDVLRFVEPETGRVVALRPDMTPQVARLVTTRMVDAPWPARLCYEGSVLRRRRERARLSRQIPQAGIELVGSRGQAGDLEVIEVAAAAVRRAGLDDFVIDLGHARIAGALLGGVAEAHRAGLVEALGLKDGAVLSRRAHQAGLPSPIANALAELPSLHGAADIWPRAEQLLAGTPAEQPAAELRRTHEAVIAAGVAPRVVVDLGETWNFAYYTGIMFQLLAAGPGQPVGSGGRYDGLLQRFGVPQAAAGFAVDLDNLAWALAEAGVEEASGLRVLVAAGEGSAERQQHVLSGLRAQAIRCAPAPDDADAAAYGRAWRYSHLLVLGAAGATLESLAGGTQESLSGNAGELVKALGERLVEEPGRSAAR